MPSFTIDSISGGPFETNAYIIVDPATRRAAVVDPGYDADSVWGRVLADNNLTLESILVTHGHIDHVCGVGAMHRAFPDVPILIHKNDERMMAEANVAVAKMFGLPPYEPAHPTGYIEEGKPVKVGSVSFDVLFVPGHCPGHVAFLAEKQLVSGDVLFAGSIGRTDLPGGDYDVLARSIVEKLLPLGDDVTVYPGHGPISTIGRERRSNPFVLEMLAA